MASYQVRWPQCFKETFCFCGAPRCQQPFFFNKIILFSITFVSADCKSYLDISMSTCQISAQGGIRPVPKVLLCNAKNASFLHYYEAKFQPFTSSKLITSLSVKKKSICSVIIHVNFMSCFSEKCNFENLCMKMLCNVISSEYVKLKVSNQQGNWQNSNSKMQYWLHRSKIGGLCFQIALRKTLGKSQN